MWRKKKFQARRKVSCTQSYFSFTLFITNLWIGEPKVNLNKVKDKHRGITSSIVLCLEPLHSTILFGDGFELLTLQLPDQICHSPHFQPDNSCDVSSENLVLDQLIIPKLIFFFILVTYIVDLVSIL